MRKLLALAVVLAVCLVPLAAWGWPTFPKITNGPLPKDPAHEVDSWELDDKDTEDPADDEWVLIAGKSHPMHPVLTANARCYAQDPDHGDCNKQDWVVNFTNHASVAQWLDWTLSATRWDWRVRKPGTYTADCITATIQSNNAVNIFYDGFDNLVRISGPGGTDPDVIEVWYAFAGNLPPPPNSNLWVAALDLNNDDDGIPDTDALHDGIEYKLWNKIVVDNSDSSCEYEDEATITISLTNMKRWIDPITGDFAPFGD